MSDSELAIEAAKAMGWHKQEGPDRVSGMPHQYPYWANELGRFAAFDYQPGARVWSPSTDANQAIEIAEHVEQTMSLRLCVDHWGSHGQYNAWFFDAKTGWKPDSSLDMNGLAASFARAVTIACLKTIAALKAHAALTAEKEGENG
jgi:hypothetical protein